jgi:hypothetical protein
MPTQQVVVFDLGTVPDLDAYRRAENLQGFELEPGRPESFRTGEAAESLQRSLFRSEVTDWRGHPPRVPSAIPGGSAGAPQPTESMR